VVLAEDFFGPTYLRMRSDFYRGDWTSAQDEQAWKVGVLLHPDDAI
jgi:hypothetical protein